MGKEMGKDSTPPTSQPSKTSFDLLYYIKQSSEHFSTFNPPWEWTQSLLQPDETKNHQLRKLLLHNIDQHAESLLKAYIQKSVRDLHN